ncbi:MAG: hypothetical protein IPK82_02105 [Polyangiaceae bacterium]|nr:hypothetical protein [Polyangiaceae bacterium]
MSAEREKKVSQTKTHSPDERTAEAAVPATDSTSPKPEPNSGLQWLMNNAWLAIVAVALLAIPAGLLQGAGAAMLVLIAAALISVIALFWNSVRTLLGETPISGADAYALAAPRAEEEQKQAVLRALKDVEFERSVGKITEEHYAELVTKYRAEAKRLLRTLDEAAGERREKVTRMVQKRLAAEGLAAPVNDVADTHRSPAAEPKKKKKKDKGDALKENETDRIQNTDVPTAGGVVIEPIAKEASEAAKPKSKSPVDITWKSPPVSKTKESPAFVSPTKTCAECHTKTIPMQTSAKNVAQNRLRPRAT